MPKTKKEKKKYFLVSISKTKYKKPKGTIIEESEVQDYIKKQTSDDKRVSIQPTERKKKNISKKNPWVEFMTNEINNYKKKNNIKKIDKNVKNNVLMPILAEKWKKIKDQKQLEELEKKINDQKKNEKIIEKKNKKIDKLDVIPNLKELERMNKEKIEKEIKENLIDETQANEEGEIFKNE